MLTMEDAIAVRENFDAWNGNSAIIDVSGNHVTLCKTLHWIRIVFYQEQKLFTCRLVTDL